MYTPPGPCSRRSAGSSGRRWVFACAARPLLGCAWARPSHFRRANKSARGGFNSRALHSRPGIRISAYACACARGVHLPPSPPKLIPSPARAGSSWPPRREHTRRSPAIPVRVAPRACCCAALGCIARAPTSACGSGCQAFQGRARVRSPWAQARFCWRGSRWPRAHAARRAAKNRGLASAAAVAGARGRCAPPHHRDKPTIHLNMIALSSLAYIRAIMNAFMFHTRRTTISWLSEQNY